MSRFCVDAPLARRRGDVRAPETDFCVCSGGTTPAARETLLPPPPSVPPPSVPPPSSAPTAIEAARLFDRASCCCCLLNAVTRLALLATALLASAVALLASLVRFSSAKSLFLRFFSSFEPLRRIVGHTRCICNPDRRRTTPKENKPNEPNDEPNDVHHRIPVAFRGFFLVLVDLFLTLVQSWKERKRGEGREKKGRKGKKEGKGEEEKRRGNQGQTQLNHPPTSRMGGGPPTYEPTRRAAFVQPIWTARPLPGKSSRHSPKPGAGQALARPGDRQPTSRGGEPRRMPPYESRTLQTRANK